ncbi:MAG: DUF1684 domain-containing protein [Chitinophagaceae bacterium]
MIVCLRIALVLFLGFGFVHPLKSQPKTSYVDEIENWHRQRGVYLRSEEGWLNLAGLFWLREGVNPFGSDSSNPIVFPKGSIAGRAGSFNRSGDTVRLIAEPDADIALGNLRIRDTVIFLGGQAVPPVLAHGTLRWTIIKREDKIGVRLRDLNSALVHSFPGIDHFSIAEKWKVMAHWQPSPARYTLPLQNIIGQQVHESSPGRVTFTLGKKEFSLEALQEGQELFLIFSDETNGVDTYPSGRYLYAPWPGKEGTTILDFNKAFNPPCAFTPYATCLLPPAQNHLALRIEAGEKVFHASTH